MAKRSERPFSCLAIDVDRFKAVNDAHGHDAGDRVLKHIAQVLRDTARAHDFIGRVGGEEFLLICPNTGAAGAQACAERLRAAVEAAELTVGNGVAALSVSIGIAVWTKDVASPDALVKAADVAMYAAKAAGRNCLSYSSAPPADPSSDNDASSTQPALPLTTSAS